MLLISTFSFIVRIVCLQKKKITNSARYGNEISLTSLLPLVPQPFKRKYDYSKEYSVAHYDQREIAFCETDSDEAGLNRAHWFSRIQAILFAIFESIFSQL